MVTPDILLIETDHDMRNPADFLVLNKLAKAVFAVPGISNVQAMTRPEGTPIDAHDDTVHDEYAERRPTTVSCRSSKDRMEDMLEQADEMANNDRHHAAHVRA